MAFISFQRVLLGSCTVESIRQYSIPEEKEDYTLSANPVLDPQLISESTEPQSVANSRSNLRLFPPPLFSRQGISQNYKCVSLSLELDAE